MNKSELMNGLQEEYRQWLALLAEIDPARMEEPGVTGHWSIKDIVAHLTGWRRRTVARLQLAQRGEADLPLPWPWPAHLKGDAQEVEINAWIYEANRGRSVREVLDDSEEIFQQMRAAIADIPEERLAEALSRFAEPGDPPPNAGTFFGHFHEEHEQEMRTALARWAGLARTKGGLEKP